MQAQAPICPFCFDDHSSLNPCDVKDLKIRIAMLKIEHIQQEIFNREYNCANQAVTLFNDRLNEIKGLLKWV